MTNKEPPASPAIAVLEERAITAARDFVERNDARIRNMPLNSASEAFQEGTEWGMKQGEAEQERLRKLLDERQLILDSERSAFDALDDNHRALQSRVAELEGTFSKVAELASVPTFEAVDETESECSICGRMVDTDDREWENGEDACWECKAHRLDEVTQVIRAALRAPAPGEAAKSRESAGEGK